MKAIKTSTLALFVFIFFSLSITAQDYARNKEKVYIHTSHVFFKPGEQVFYKIYVVNAQDQSPARVSDIVYVELISPAGAVIQKNNYALRDGYSEGSFDFGDAAPGGIYRVRAYTSWMRNEKDDRFFVKEITLQKTLAPRVLMKLDFPSKGYGPGDIAKANFSMRNLAGQAIRGYKGNYTVSIAGGITTTGTFKTDNEGKAVIECPLPANLSVNDGLLNVTIDYDAFIESIARSIPIVLNRIDLQFMPEGGTMVDDVESVVAFKALNEFGKAADIKGEIRDAAGNSVAKFESYHFGMGKFLFTPRPGQQYKAFITSPTSISQVYDLPTASPQGIAMRIAREDKLVMVNMTASQETMVILKASSRDSTYYVRMMQLHAGINRVSIDEKLFPPGIAQVTLFDTGGLPLAERLLFMHSHAQLKVEITTSKEVYMPREKVNLLIKTTDEKGHPLPSNISLAVMDDKLWTFADDKQDNILSWLLLSSELAGKIEEPFFYFKKSEPKAEPALDLLMLTHGYRYFDYIEDVVSNGRLKFLPDQPNILSGRITTADNRPMPATVYLLHNSYTGKAMKITTSADGEFFFTHLQPLNKYYVFAHALQKKKLVKIEITQNGNGFNPSLVREGKHVLSRESDKSIAANFSPRPDIALKKQLLMEIQPLAKESNLGEVVIVAMGAERSRKLLGYSINRIDSKDLSGAVNLNNGLTGRVAGLQIAQNANIFDNSKITLRGLRSTNGNNQPLFVVNGILLDQFSLTTVNPNDIESVTIMKDAAATSIFGSAAANGVIQIELKKWRRERVRINLSNVHYYASQLVATGGSSYSVARKFYVPKYASTITDERTDFRETIYWNPVIQTDKDGKATVEFYNSDATTTFRTLAEGIGYNGRVGRTEMTYAVQQALQVDAKIPPYLTVGDKALVPLVIKNNRAQSEKISIAVTATNEYRIGAFAKEAELLPGQSLRVLVPLEALKGSKGELKFFVTSGSSREVLKLPVESAGKGFPARLSFSGNNSAQHHFSIDNMIEGTLNAEVKLFKNTEGQLLEGIESMLREPYGCFEQTSSTTYPNIYVLKYLQESGRSNPEIEKKAMAYIKAGYKRLVSFETLVGGFEWFGKTPPHEALTAYGLLEFTDMQAFIDVDQGMLDRTRKFLLKRRDGKGAFQLATGGYDRFASVPNKIANIYIVYAMARAGMGKDILPEYQSALKEAMTGKDSYQLAMMANAAFYMQDDRSYLQLLDILRKEPKLEAATSVVNSREASLRVETNALYANALMKSKTPDIGKIASLVSSILSEKCYYGYGSTQATVMALEALVNYSKLVNRVTDDSPVLFTINKETLNDNNPAATSLREGANSIGISYSKPQTGLPYSIDISYSTLLPPSSNKAEIELSTNLPSGKVELGSTIRMEIVVTNTKDQLQPMAIAKIGIPAGLLVQPWQLKEITEKNKAAYYEIFDNYLVFYWMGFAPKEVKKIELDLKAEIPGNYKAKASTAYLYYTPEYKYWSEGAEVMVGDGADGSK